MANMDLSKASRDELVQYVKCMIWNDQGVDSYKILSWLVEAGWKYDEKAFQDIMWKIRSCEEIVSYEDIDVLLCCKPLTIDALVLTRGRKCNCYDCDFLQKAEHNYRIKKLMSRLRGRDGSLVDDYDKRYCALNPTLHIHLGMDSIPKRCPINEAIAKMTKEGEG